jgi:NAD(P)-dependent dehydrogenase (short-subunit alcohol dehydrogenase family)
MVAGNRVLIVGGSSGIGFATAKLFVQQGAETTVASHDPG